MHPHAGKQRERQADVQEDEQREEAIRRFPGARGDAQPFQRREEGELPEGVMKLGKYPDDSAVNYIIENYWE